MFSFSFTSPLGYFTFNYFQKMMVPWVFSALIFSSANQSSRQSMADLQPPPSRTQPPELQHSQKRSQLQSSNPSISPLVATCSSPSYHQLSSSTFNPMLHPFWPRRPGAFAAECAGGMHNDQTTWGSALAGNVDRG